jgi:hypothetical protein
VRLAKGKAIDRVNQLPGRRLHPIRIR